MSLGRAGKLAWQAVFSPRSKVVRHHGAGLCPPWHTSMLRPGLQSRSRTQLGQGARGCFGALDVSLRSREHAGRGVLLIVLQLPSEGNSVPPHACRR